ncbi:hypothetical protein AOCH_006183 [Aspergillus ochraceoroseus]|uniref:Kinesin light chain n=1 Tax=Aspergillus ochraceoroseus TaxID=138278 RepID=A0A0F8XRN5_9EURO|nr:hypothetical protein AOCH_006183 [Aspergillus ochraceoroseus]
MTNLAMTYDHQGRWDKAEELGAKSLKARQEVLGPEHPDTLTSINNLALVYMHQGRWIEAHELQLQTMKIQKRVLGLEHPETLGTMHNLACTNKALNNPDALEMMARCLKHRRETLGGEHPDTVFSARILSNWKKEQGVSPAYGLVQPSERTEGAQDAYPTLEAQSIRKCGIPHFLGKGSEFITGYLEPTEQRLYDI